MLCYMKDIYTYIYTVFIFITSDAYRERRLWVAYWHYYHSQQPLAQSICCSITTKTESCVYSVSPNMFLTLTERQAFYKTAAALLPTISSLHSTDTNHFLLLPIFFLARLHT